MNSNPPPPPAQSPTPSSARPVPCDAAGLRPPASPQVQLLQSHPPGWSRSSVSMPPAHSHSPTLGCYCLAHLARRTAQQAQRAAAGQRPRLPPRGGPARGSCCAVAALAPARAPPSLQEGMGRGRGACSVVGHKTGTEQGSLRDIGGGVVCTRSSSSSSPSASAAGGSTRCRKGRGTPGRERGKQGGSWGMSEGRCVHTLTLHARCMLEARARDEGGRGCISAFQHALDLITPRQHPPGSSPTCRPFAHDW